MLTATSGELAAASLFLVVLVLVLQFSGISSIPVRPFATLGGSSCLPPNLQPAKIGRVSHCRKESTWLRILVCKNFSVRCTLSSCVRPKPSRAQV